MKRKQQLHKDIMNITKAGLLGGTGVMAIGSVVGETGGIANVMKFLPLYGTVKGSEFLLSSTKGLSQSAGLWQKKRKRLWD